MGMGKPSGGIKTQLGKIGSLKAYGDPNTRIDLYNIENPNELLQQRWYDAEGKAIWDRDWKHNDSNNTHTFPHDHYWDWEKNSEHPPRLEYVGPNGEKINMNYC